MGWRDKFETCRQEMSDCLRRTFQVHSTYDLMRLDEETKGQADRGAILHDYAWSSSMHHILLHTTVGFLIGAGCSLILFKRKS